MSEVKAFKLSTGEEVIAEVLSTNTALGLHLDPSSKGQVLSYNIRRPHTLQFQNMGSGQVGLALVPWTLSNPTIANLTLPSDVVLLTFSPDANVEKQYLQQTSGISLATSI